MTVEERLEKFLGREPDTCRAAFVAPTASVMGDVRLGQDASVWYGAILRGDIASIEIGDRSNVQDGSVVHLADDLGVKVGKDVTIGHGAIIHACEIGDECLIGMGSTILDGAVIGSQCIVGARALVTPGTKIPDGSMVLGSPAKVTRALSPEERDRLKSWARKYVKVAGAHAAHQARRAGKT